MSRKVKRVWISKSHLFKKTFLKLGLQFIMLRKYSDKLYSKCFKIFKLYLTIRWMQFHCRVSCVITHFSYLAAKLLLLIFLNVLLETKFVMWRRSLWRIKLSTDLQKKSRGLFLCGRDMRITIVQLNQNEYDFYESVFETCNYVNKETLSQMFSCKFCEFFHSDCIWDSCEKFLDDCFKIFYYRTNRNPVFSIKAFCIQWSCVLEPSSFTEKRLIICLKLQARKHKSILSKSKMCDAHWLYCYKER